jgi:hypothetical protein
MEQCVASMTRGMLQQRRCEAATALVAAFARKTTVAF